ncbi:hypothetical protein, partial [Acidiphilium multivorum]|uniref:hypothetical protein n=1 Tax=Acidiphilium multivorum TaxID=62140 RepID=UPI0006628E16
MTKPAGAATLTAPPLTRSYSLLVKPGRRPVTGASGLVLPVVPVALESVPVTAVTAPVTGANRVVVPVVEPPVGRVLVAVASVPVIGASAPVALVVEPP